MKTWAEFYKFGLQAMPARIRGLNVLALLVGTSKAVPLQMVLGLTLEGCAGSHRDHRSSNVHHSARGGHGAATGVARMTVKNSSLDITRISVLKKVSPDRQHGSARWTRACQQLAAQGCVFSPG